MQSLSPLCLLLALCVALAGAVDYAAVRRDILAKLRPDMHKAPTLFRLSWHSSGTYDKVSHTGGSYEGTIRFPEELAHVANPGLGRIEAFVQPIYDKYKGQGMSYADFYTLGGVVALESMGGPLIPWRAGRVDTMDHSEVTPDGRLPDPDAGSSILTIEGLRKTFYRMGFNDREIVVLSGAHTVGECHHRDSGYDGPWTTEPTTFTNLFYIFLLNNQWVTETLDTGKTQYTNLPTKNLMMLPSDYALIQDPIFKLYVQMYAADQNLFFTDFAVAYKKLIELGCKGLYDVELIPKVATT